MDDVPGFWGLILFNCGAASLVVGIMMDAFCVPLFGTTECEYNKMPSNLQTYVLFLVVVLCSVIWLCLVETCYSCYMGKLDKLREDEKAKEREDWQRGARRADAAAAAPAEVAPEQDDFANANSRDDEDEDSDEEAYYEEEDDEEDDEDEEGALHEPFV